MSNRQDPVQVRFDPLVPLRIRLQPPLEPEKPELMPSERLQRVWLACWRDPLFRFGVVVSFLLLLMLGALWRQYASPFAQVVEEGKVLHRDLASSICYPRYLAPGDEESVAITIVNGSPTLSQTRAVSATLFFTSSLPVATGDKDSNRVSFGNMTPGERKTRTISLRLDEQLQGPLTATLWLATDTAGPEMVGELQFDTLPLRNEKAGLRWLFGGIWTVVVPAATGWALRTAFKKSD